jgi:hypothetical protein
MQLARFVSMLGSILILCLAGFVVGCGSGDQVSSPGATPDAKGRQELQRKAQYEAKKAIANGKARGKSMP